MCRDTCDTGDTSRETCDTSDTCRDTSDTCRETSNTCRDTCDTSDTCRDTSDTSRDTGDTSDTLPNHQDFGLHQVDSIFARVIVSVAFSVQGKTADMTTKLLHLAHKWQGDAALDLR
mmetsp:Transcript_112130/g.182798  ORF Transcript_112130/g.182798 Transcript_112130/m.182798 type:complete len:117 (-) Transcript_112130:77-427(-)